MIWVLIYLNITIVGTTTTYNIAGLPFKSELGCLRKKAEYDNETKIDSKFYQTLCVKETMRK